MNMIAYTCPCCGAPLAFSGVSGKLECASCGNAYETEAIEAMNPASENDFVQFDLPKETFGEENAAGMQAYICKGCGAELMTEDTTTATECPYCGSPTILPDRIEGGALDFVVVGNPMPGLTWTKADSGNFMVDMYGNTLEIVWTEEGFDMNYMDAMLMHFVPEA